MRRRVIVPVFVVAGLALAACGSGSGSGSQDTANQTTGSAAATTGTDTAKKSIGIVTFSATDPSVNIVVDNIRKLATEKGYSSTVIDANGSVDQANTAMQNLVQKKVSGIAVTVFPASSLAAGLASAKAAGIPVVNTGGGKADGIVVNVDDSQGEKVTQQLIDDMGGTGQVLTLTYLGGRPCQLRLASFEKLVAEKAPNLKVTKQAITVPGQVESATSATLAWLAAHPAGSAEHFAIYACFDDPGLGAISALKQQNRKDVKVYAFNGTKPALKEVKDGWMTATLWINQPEVGTTMFNGLDEAMGNPGMTPKEAPAPSTLVGADNFDSFIAEHPTEAP